MKKISSALLGLLLWSNSGQAQSKVFKEVSKDIESKIEIIMQENNFVGYLVFTKLEKASKDSFLYRINIMDENLNDIGEYKFKNINLEIQDVVYDQEVLCIGYISNNAPNTMVSKTIAWSANDNFKVKNYPAEVKKIKSSIYFQFLDLKGKLVNEYSEPVNLTFVEAEFSKTYATYVRNSFRGSLRTPIKIKNIPNKGFFVSYTESNFVNGTKIKDGNEIASASCKQKMHLFDFKGNVMWKNQLPESKIIYAVPLASENNIYILRKNYLKSEKIPNQGDFDLLSLSTNDGRVHKQEKVGDNGGNSFQVLNFSNEVDLDNPIVSGVITKKGALIKDWRSATRGSNLGVFNIKAKDSTFIKQVSYWNEGQLKPEISKKSYLQQTKTYPNISYSFADEQGNVYYIGPGVLKKPRWGLITVGVITTPIAFIGPLILIGNGTNMHSLKDETVIRQDASGKLSFHSSYKVNNQKLGGIRFSHPFMKTDKSYFTVNQNKYLVINDLKDIFVFDIPNKSLVKKIPHKQGDVRVEVYKAKEGHIMLSEYNKDDGSTKYSIEAL